VSSGGQHTVHVGRWRGKAWLWSGVGMSSGAGVMSGAQWRSRVTRGAVESRGQRWGSGCVSLLFFQVTRPGFGQGRQGIDKGESRALLGGQRLGLGLPTTVANS
jgi:hypothetical protein